MNASKDFQSAKVFIHGLKDYKINIYEILTFAMNFKKFRRNAIKFY